jgi:hypothetical protein
MPFGNTKPLVTNKTKWTRAGFSFQVLWRRCMGIEPTQNGASALLTVLKTAEPTRTLPPPMLVESV